MSNKLLFDRLAPLYVIIAAALWGVDSIVLRPSLYSLPVPLVVFIESAIVAIILSPIFIRQSKIIQSLGKKDILAFLGVAVFGGAIGTMAITKALFYVDYVNLSIVVLIQKLQPVFALILARLLLKESLPKLQKMLCNICFLKLIIFHSHLPQIHYSNLLIFLLV